jgi:hypothetical protein
MVEGRFLIQRVDELFDIASGIVMVTTEGGTGIPLDAPSYVRSKESIARALGIPIAEVSLVGRSVALNEDGFFDLVE